MSQESEAHPSEEVHIYEGKTVEVGISMFKLPNGYGYARVAVKAIGGETGVGSLAPGSTPEQIMAAIRAMQSEESVRKCGFESYGGLGEESVVDWKSAEASDPWIRAAGHGRMQRVSASNMVHSCDAIAQSLDLIKERGGLVDWSARVDGAMVDLRSWARSARNAAHLLDLGVFECPSGVLWASDPCYDSADPDAQSDMLSGASGSWHAYSTRRGCGAWGDRSAQILIVREGDDPLPWLAEAAARPWSDSGIECGVDSGQAGFFDMRIPGGPGGENDPFYDACSDQTLGFMKAGVIEGGAVGRSGDGDGGYPIQISRSEDGTLVAARILFYAPDPDEVLAWREAVAANEALALSAVAQPGGRGPGGKAI